MKQKYFKSIRAKLLAFTVLLCAVLMGLVWLLNVQLLEPLYNRRIEKQLRGTAEEYAQVLRKYDAIEDSNSQSGLNEEFRAEINALDNDNLLAGKCLDISGANCLNLLHAHYIEGECRLHPSQEGFFGERRDAAWNTQYIIQLRAMTLRNGDMTFTIQDDGKPQKVYCKNVDDKYVVIVSSDLQRIDEAAGVIRMQIPMVACMVLLLGIAGAWWFSCWFSRPLTEISSAAREMARGNYKVRVQKTTNDEIGTLADDFNTMANEVARTAELQRELIANVSHDLRTPLTLIKGYAETVRDLTGDNVEKRTAQLDIIVDETDRLSVLVNGVMELSKYAAGNQKINPVPFDLAQLCEEVAQRYEDICAKNNYQLVLKTDAACPVTADPDMLSRVIHNLLSNAIAHIGADGWVQLSALPQADGTVRVEIADHGTGIAEDDLPYIFDKYYRARADAGKIGTGLGLSITKAILIQHGFAFGVQSQKDAGSTFWFIAK